MKMSITLIIIIIIQDHIDMPISINYTLISIILVFLALTRISVAISCQASHNRADVGGVCVCIDGFYDTGTPTCPNCNTLCKTCVTTATTCTSCDSTLKLTLSGSTCVCMDGYVMIMSVCQSCHYSCATCSGTAANNCLTCNTTVRLFMATSTTCPCFNGTYDNSTTQFCQPCSIKCLWCSASTTNDCTNCDTNLVRVIGTSNPGPCLCSAGYYDVTNVALCAQCNYTCATCMTTSTTCTTCNSALFRTISGTSCPCNSHYYDAGVATCSMCSPRCGNCVTAATTCLTCNTSLRTLTGTNCPCNPGYYEDVLTVTLDCNPCTNYCKTCTNTSSTCLSCYSGYNRLLNNATCNCIAGYYDNGTITCQICPYYCLTCVGPDPPSCTTCDTAKHRTLTGGLCPCDGGYFDSGVAMCQPCVYSCGTCSSSAILCTSCPTNSHRTLVATDCNCTVGYYDDYTNPLCPACHYTCVSCYGGSSNQCYTCQVNRNYTNYSCPCNTGMYESGQLCYYCNTLCVTCIGSSTNCTSCSADRALSSGTCVCADGYYASGAITCSPCSQQCLTCTTTANTCLSCPASHLTVLSYSSCICPASFFMPANSLICSPCHYSCSTCQTSFSSTDCLSCSSASHRTLVAGSCVCNTGYYDSGTTECPACHYSCLSCISGGTQYNCSACINSSYWLIGSYCRPRLTCTNYNYNGFCVNTCPDGSYGVYSLILLGNTCTQCTNNCMTCSSPTYCSSCMPNTYLFTNNNTCVDLCPNGYYIASGGRCSPCPASCIACVFSQWSNAVACSVCASGYVMQDYGQCVSGCGDGFALNTTDGRCHRCSTHCQLCPTDWVTGCTQCQSGYLLLNGSCFNVCPLGYTPSIDGTVCSTCPASCLTCYLNTCLSCAISYYLSAAMQCISEGYFRNTGGVLQRCHANCLSCTDVSFSSCITCQQGRGDSAQMAISGYCSCQQDVLDIGPGLCDVSGQYESYRVANKVVIGASHASVYLGVVLSVLTTNFLPVISFVNYMQTYSNLYFANMSAVLQTDTILHEYRKINPITYYRSTFTANTSTNSIMKGNARLLASTQMDESLFLRGDEFLYLVEWGFPAFVLNIIAWGTTIMLLLCRCLCSGKGKNSVTNKYWVDKQQMIRQPTPRQNNLLKVQSKAKLTPLSLQKPKLNKSDLLQKQSEMHLPKPVPQSKSANKNTIQPPSSVSTHSSKCLCCRCPFVLKYSLSYYISYCFSLHHESTAIIIYLLTYSQILLYAAFFFKTLHRLRQDDVTYPIDSVQIALSVILTVYYIAYPIRLAIGAYKYTHNIQQSKRSPIRILFHQYRQSATSKSNRLFLPLLLIRNAAIPILIVFLAFNPLYQCLSVALLVLVSMLVNLCICPYESVMRALFHLSDLVLVLQLVILTVTSMTAQNNRIMASEVLIIANFVQTVIMVVCCAWLLYTVFRDQMCNTHKKHKKANLDTKQDTRDKTLVRSPYQEDSLSNILQKQDPIHPQIEQQMQASLPMRLKVNGLPFQQFTQWADDPAMNNNKITSNTPPQYPNSTMDAAITKSKSEAKLTKRYRVKRKQENQNNNI